MNQQKTKENILIAIKANIKELIKKTKNYTSTIRIIID